MGKRKLFVDDQDKFIFAEFHVDQGVKQAAVAESYRVESDTIDSIRTILDTPPFMSAGGTRTDAERAAGRTCPNLRVRLRREISP